METLITAFGQIHQRCCFSSRYSRIHPPTFTFEDIIQILVNVKSMGWKTAWTPALFGWFSLNLEPHPISHLPPKLLLVLINTSLPLPSPLLFSFVSSASSMVPPLPPQYHNTIKISCVSVLLWAEPVLVWPTASTDPVFET